MSERPFADRVFEEVYLDSLKKGTGVEASSKLAREAAEEAREAMSEMRRQNTRIGFAPPNPPQCEVVRQ